MRYLPEWNHDLLVEVSGAAEATAASSYCLLTCVFAWICLLNESRFEYESISKDTIVGCHGAKRGET